MKAATATSSSVSASAAKRANQTSRTPARSPSGRFSFSPGPFARRSATADGPYRAGHVRACVPVRLCCRARCRISSAPRGISGSPRGPTGWRNSRWPAPCRASPRQARSTDPHRADKSSFNAGGRPRARQTGKQTAPGHGDYRGWHRSFLDPQARRG